MRLSALLGLIVFGWYQPDLQATSCSVPPPCELVEPGSVLFVGTVLDPGIPTTPDDQSVRDVTFQVDEIFEGLPRSTKKVVVRTEGSWLEKGHSYLMDVGKGAENHLYPRICGASEEVTSRFAEDNLAFLRLRARGKTKTSLYVNVVDQHKPVADVVVTIHGPQGQLTARTDADGTASFSEIKPARYSVSAVLAHYKMDPDSHSDEAVDVVIGACSGARIEIQSDAAVNGQVFDSKGVPVASLQLELVTDPQDPAKKISLNKPFFDATTNADGSFSFQSVSPGRYLLGSNIIGLNSSTVPPTYYPGQRNRNGAYPIEVKLGETVSNLRFALPDFGGQREIQVCVVDEDGTPIPSAIIAPDYGTKGPDFAQLTKLSTSETGCASANGYTGVAYSIHAVLRPEGADIWHIRMSDFFVVDPGEEPVHAVLVLHKPLGSPSRKK